jgi:DNA-binding HxlR family transcriptional regulator
MSILPASPDQHLVSALGCELSFDILRLLKTDGMTTRELFEKLPGTRTHTVYTCLENLWRAGLLFRLRCDKTYEWWPNRKGITDAAARLLEYSAMIPQRDLETISKLSDQNSVISRQAKFIEVSYRAEILRAVRNQPATMSEISHRIASRVGPAALSVSLQTLEIFKLIASRLILIPKPVGGFHTKQYTITPKGVIALEALHGDRPLRDILKAGALDGEGANPR